MKNKVPRKVLYLVTKSNWGGAQRYVYDLATHLDRTQYEPVVALGGDGTLSEMLRNSQIRVINLKELKNSHDLKQLGRALVELRDIVRAEKPDVLHVNSSVAGIIGALIGRWLGVPKVIFTAHGWAFNEDRKLWQRIVIKFLHWVTVLLSHRTIAVSSAIVRQMNWPLAERKMKIIHPGRTIGVMFSKPEAREKITDFFPQLQPYKSDIWILCVAELHPIKRHKILFQALANLTHTHKNIRLLCFGDGTLREELHSWVHTHGLQDTILLLGNLHEAARFLKAGDLFVLASKSESYGYVLHEAGLAGLPVVATHVGGIPDIITNKETGLLVEPNNHRALSVALATYLDNKDYAARLATNLHVAMERRSVAHMSRQTIPLYQD